MFCVRCISVGALSLRLREAIETELKSKGRLIGPLNWMLNAFSVLFFHLIGASHRKQFFWEIRKKTERRRRASWKVPEKKHFGREIQSRIQENQINCLILWMCLRCRRSEKPKPLSPCSIFVVTRFFPNFFFSFSFWCDNSTKSSNISSARITHTHTPKADIEEEEQSKQFGFIDGMRANEENFVALNSLIMTSKRPTKRTLAQTICIYVYSIPYTMGLHSVFDAV